MSTSNWYWSCRFCWVVDFSVWRLLFYFQKHTHTHTSNNGVWIVIKGLHCESVWCDSLTRLTDSLHLFKPVIKPRIPHLSLYWCSAVHFIWYASRLTGWQCWEVGRSLRSGQPTQIIIWNQLHLFSHVTAGFSHTAAGLSASTYHCETRGFRCLSVVAALLFDTWCHKIPKLNRLTTQAAVSCESAGHVTFLYHTFTVVFYFMLCYSFIRDTQWWQ